MPRGMPSITPDLSRVHRFNPPKSQGPDWNSSASKKEETYRLDTTVTVLKVVNKTGGALLEVRFRDENTTADVLQREKRQCAGLEDDETGKHADIEKNKESGLFDGATECLATECH